MPSFIVFGIRVDNQQTTPKYSNKEDLNFIVKKELQNRFVKKVVIECLWR